MRVAVIAVQGAVSEHVEAVERAMERMGVDGRAIATLKPEEVRESDAIILPGGESTTIGKLIWKNGIAEEIIRAANDGRPVMGTCAGCILMAKHGDEQIERTGTRLLGLMNIWVKRNAFGRQRESFQTMLKIKHIGDFEGVFIRAPAILKAGEEVEVLSTLEEYIVGAKQNNMLALAFHPELTGDTRIHEYFIRMAL
ncbi:MAG: pyridoxal 5'-phosphate synthase glutaminase subunit PdxT [Thermoplasmata archaeon]|jgi:5'-phosphate synthase pdxT subunit|nr:pyridoxal 5'-phosphate synthase glutaminase subunit PdxT [Thermoplasmata archaeon]